MTTKFRSKFEEKFFHALPSNSTEYETKKFKYIVPASAHTYTCDLYVKHLDLHLELKGILDAASRRKMILVRDQHPELNIAFVFQRHTNKISKGSNTTYGDWAEKNGFKWYTPAEAIELIKESK